MPNNNLDITKILRATPPVIYAGAYFIFALAFRDMASRIPEHLITMGGLLYILNHLWPKISVDQ